MSDYEEEIGAVMMSSTAWSTPIKELTETLTMLLAITEKHGLGAAETSIVGTVIELLKTEVEQQHRAQKEAVAELSREAIKKDNVTPLKKK